VRIMLFRWVAIALAGGAPGATMTTEPAATSVPLTPEVDDTNARSASATPIAVMAAPEGGVLPGEEPEVQLFFRDREVAVATPAPVFEIGKTAAPIASELQADVTTPTVVTPVAVAETDVVVPVDVSKIGSALANTPESGSAAAGEVAPVDVTELMPAPTREPMSVSAAGDPILSLADDAVSRDVFQSAIARAVDANPAVAVGRAQEDVADAAKREARSALFPTIDLGINANQTISRKFSSDPNLIIERSRPTGRVDATASVQQTLFDFGASSHRIEAASARIEAAAADSDNAAAGVALRAIGAWYDVFGYGQLSRLGRTYVINQQELRSAVDTRIRAGVSAPVDRARVDSSIASAELRLAQFHRALGNAQARYVEIFKAVPESPFHRAPAPGLAPQSQDLVAKRASQSPVVASAKAQALAARADARAARSDTLPNISAGLDAGRYGLLEVGRDDYDVRARVSVRQRLFGPGAARSAQARARADVATARASAIEDEAVREANIAWTDVSVMRNMMAAYAVNYIAARKTRDAVVERFRVSRGSLFDVLDAEDRFFDAAASYIRVLSEYDTARYILLARSGQLLEALAIQPAKSRAFR
jgi:outer membrane protein, adhesin transport system